MPVDKKFEISDDNLAVQIASGYKSYGKFEVLKNLNLNVPTGAIYGLLGPSGCGIWNSFLYYQIHEIKFNKIKIGKTTILRSIVGRLYLDSGELIVLGKKPGARNHGIPGINIIDFFITC